jgi:hypothetical protein
MFQLQRVTLYFKKLRLSNVSHFSVFLTSLFTRVLHICSPLYDIYFLISCQSLFTSVLI